jgi:hypothetical protein
LHTETVAKRERRWGRGLLTVIALLAFGPFVSACVGNLISAPPTAHIASSQPPSVGLVAGVPITSTAQTTAVPNSPDGRSLIPVGASDTSVLLRSGGQFNGGGSASYQIWDPTSGAPSPIPGWSSSDTRDRVLGLFGDWAVVTHDDPGQGGASVVQLRNVHSGESRDIGTSGDASTGGQVVASNGWVAWTDLSAGHSGVWVYEIASGKSTIVQAMVRRISSLAVANGVVAWWQGQGFNGQSPRIVVRDTAANNFQSVEASGVRALALSADGQTLVWLQDSGTGGPGLYVHDLKSGSGGRLFGGQSIGVSLSVSGDYISWQPGNSGGSATAGLYNVKTHELRVVQSPPGTAPRLARVMGGWFFWSDPRTQAATSTPGSPIAGCCYLLRLQKS